MNLLLPLSFSIFVLPVYSAVQSTPSVIMKECIQYEAVPFKKISEIKVGTSPRYGHVSSVGNVGDYTIQVGWEENKVVNAKTKKECYFSGRLFNDNFSYEAKKIKGQNILVLDSDGDSSSLIELDSCTTLWSIGLDPQANKMVSIVDKVSNSSWKRCHPCWNSSTKECKQL